MTSVEMEKLATKTRHLKIESMFKQNITKPDNKVIDEVKKPLN